jgi:hypothetical protein
MFASFVMWFKIFDEKKQPKLKDENVLAFSSSKWHWHIHVKTHKSICVLLKGKIDQWGVNCDNSFLWLELYLKQQSF